MPLFSPSLHSTPVAPSVEHSSSKTDRADSEFANRVVVYNASTEQVFSSHVGMIPYKGLWIFPLHGYITDSWSVITNNLTNSTTVPKIIFTVPFKIKLVRCYQTVSGLQTTTNAPVTQAIDVTRNGTSIFSNTTSITGNLSIATQSGANQRTGISSSVTPGSGVSTAHEIWNQGDVMRIFQVTGLRAINQNVSNDRHKGPKFNVVYYRVP